MMEIDPEIKKKINTLIRLAEADKHFANIEREMIHRIAKERNFPEEEISKLIRNPEPIHIPDLPQHEQKFSYLMDCIDLVVVDHKIFESELIFVRGIATRLGFRKEIIDFLVENNGIQSREELQKIAIQDFIA